uniref:Mevalonyl-coenzyme A hydratase sidH ) n=1 Tax=Ganoderma boninense TaxID=34458 RepID=A0A5K1K008_9APHY|nr:Mevalonyl-coenzyme A hydratase sidH (EC (Siderophore biosynthesis protein H) [Ganoderma boninense]
MSSHRSAGHTISGHGYQPQQGASDTPDILWTPERCLEMYQTANERYWADHGLRMNHSSTPSYSLQESTSMAGQFQRASVTGYYPNPGSAQIYRVLPQEDYVATRRYQPQNPIIFRASPSVGYVRLADFHPSYTAAVIPPLEGGEDTVFSEDNLSQKQSIRLHINGCRPYEKQINVRNPSNNLKSITRRKLAEKVAKEICDDFMSRSQTIIGDPSLALGPGAKGFDRLVLIELRHVSRSSWQPILGVLPPHN